MDIDYIPTIVGVIIIFVAVPYLHVKYKIRFFFTFLLVASGCFLITYFNWEYVQVRIDERKRITVTLKAKERNAISDYLAKNKQIINEAAKASKKEKAISIGTLSNIIVLQDRISQNLDKFKNLLEQTKVKNQYSFDDWYYKGAGEFINKNYAAAIISFENALKKAPNDNSILSYAYNYRGAAYANHGEPEKAFKDYNKAIKLLPKSPLPYSNIGRYYYYYVKDYEKAFNNLNKASELYINKGNYIWASDNIVETLSLLENKDIDEGLRKTVEGDIEQLEKQLEDSKKE